MSANMEDKTEMGSQHARDREATCRKLIHAVGTVIQKYGYTKLGVNKIAKEANVDKVLIYRYFGNVDRLIETYISSKGYWLLKQDQLGEQAQQEEHDLAKEIADILEHQFRFFMSQQEMQQLILWELNGSQTMKSISIAREHLGEKFMKLTDEYFEDAGLEFRALGSVLSAGIYYLVLHAPVSTYCGIDLNIAEHQDALLRTIRALIYDAFDRAKKRKKKS